MKTKSGAKKRFRITSSGAVKVTQSGKRHGMRKRSSRSIREQRGMISLHNSKVALVKRLMPNG